MRLIDHSTDRLTLLQLHLGGDRNWQYLLADPVTGRAAAVDCGHDPAGLVQAAGDHGLAIAVILVTHGHGDHVGGVAELAAATGAPIHAGPQSRVPGARALSDRQGVDVDGLAITTLVTPGHAPDHVCFLCQDALVSGDLLFCGKVGGTGPHFPGSSAAAEWDSLQRLLTLPDATRVFPGHDYYGGAGEMTASTIGHERIHNPFLTCADLAAFEHLKADWARYKAEHGIR
ncbi:MAG: hydroxyacylglutathione hydrolase family protein [Candidatus Krumholzibacteriia bacterium]